VVYIVREPGYNTCWTQQTLNLPHAPELAALEGVDCISDTRFGAGGAGLRRWGPATLMTKGTTPALADRRLVMIKLTMAGDFSWNAAPAKLAL
jgi:hypothetical protein